MKKPTIFDAPYAQALSLGTQAEVAVNFLMRNLKLVTLNANDLKTIAETRIIAKTPATDIFQQIVASGKLSSFLFLDFSNFNDSIPEALTLNEMTIDGRYIQGNDIPELKKIWVNLTPYLGKRMSASSPIVINDTPSLFNLVTRGALSISYNDSDSWLTNKLSAFIIETYSMTITTLVKRQYDLDIVEAMFVQTLFATYCAQMLGAHDAPLKVPPLLYQCPFLGSVAEITERLEIINHLRENNGESVMTPFDICMIIAKSNIVPRMHQFNKQKLNVFFSTGSGDSQSMMIALDYLPYWVYQLIKNISGGKNPVLSTIFKIQKMREKVLQFCQELVKSNTFIDRIDR